MGFEPMTPALRERCSGQLSYVGVGGECSRGFAFSWAMDHKPKTHVARRFRERLLGLAWARSPRVDALLLPRCRSVHTFGMRFPLDLYWLDAAGEIVRVDLGVPPRRFRRCRAARSVVEVPAQPGEPTRRRSRSDSEVSARSSWTLSWSD